MAAKDTTILTIQQDEKRSFFVHKGEEDCFGPRDLRFDRLYAPDVVSDTEHLNANHEENGEHTFASMELKAAGCTVLSGKVGYVGGLEAEFHFSGFTDINQYLTRRENQCNWRYVLDAEAFKNGSQLIIGCAADVLRHHVITRWFRSGFPLSPAILRFRE